MGCKDVHFNVAALDAFIQEKGISVNVYAASRCPCASPDTEQPDPLCVVCEGLGYLYEATPTATKALLTSDEHKKRRIVPGEVHTGEISCTLPTGVTTAFMDKVMPADERCIINDELLTRGALSILGKSLEVLRMGHPIELLTVRDIHRSYTIDTDLALSGRSILWLPGASSPEDGARYTVRYSAQAEYVVFESQPRVRAEHDVQVPWFAKLLRMDYYWRRKGMGDLS